jgi:energy-coupling factor transporter ATP-binding protein EcfA2
MRLHSLQYVEFSDRPYAWRLEEFTLININLVVGRNAIGKTRLLRVVKGLARQIVGSLKVTEGASKIVLKDPKKKSPDLTYEVEIFEGAVKSEKLLVDGEPKLTRDNTGRGSVWFAKQGDFIDIQVPQADLAVATRRDAIQHPFFEQLHQWATTVRECDFTAQRNDNAAVLDKNAEWDAVRISEFDNIQALFKVGNKRFGRDLVSPVVSNMRKLGYELTDLGTMPLAGVASPFLQSPEILYVSEAGVEKKLPQNEISSGMFRALALLIRLQLIQLERKPSCILIDDIGEGLDFDRAKELIAIVIGMAEKGQSQYIVATNDRFVMNNVPLNYWCVLDRDRGNVRSYTPRNSPETFRDFEELGFNNFDFFAKGFFSKSIKKADKKTDKQ